MLEGLWKRAVVSTAGLFRIPLVTPTLYLTQGQEEMGTSTRQMGPSHLDHFFPPQILCALNRDVEVKTIPPLVVRAEDLCGSSYLP